MRPAPTPRVAAQRLDADREALRALRNLLDYAPRNPALSLESLAALESNLNQCEQAEEQVRWDYEQRREQTTEAGQAFHEAIGAMKNEVIAQYGSDSLALHAVGLKKRSEYRRPTRRKAEPAA